VGGTLVLDALWRRVRCARPVQHGEADEDYRTIERLCPTAMKRADATAVQVKSLTHRNRFAEAVALGIDSLRELGVTVPTPDRLADELDHWFDHLYRWLDHTDAADDLARPDITDPTLLAATRLIDAVLPAAFLVRRLHVCVAEHGVAADLARARPGRTLVGPVGVAVFAAVALRGDYAAGYRATRRILALGEARGYEPDTSRARHVFAILSC
jgi:hypothetical protein